MILKMRQAVVRSNTGQAVTTLERHVKAYRKQGLQPLPILPNEKRPSVKDWQKLDHEPFEFNGTGNLGLLTGVETKNGWFCVLDLDLSSTDYHTKTLRTFIIKLFEKLLGASVLVESGGDHYGMHLWLYLDEPINEKIKVTVTLNHPGAGTRYAIEVYCQGKQNGFNIVCPPSRVVRPYRFIGDYPLADIDKHILQIKKSDLLDFINGKRLAKILKLAHLSTMLNSLYCDGSVDGATIDFALSVYLLNALKLDDMELMHLSFQLAFGERYEHDRTEYLLERTGERLASVETMVGIGSVVELVNGDTQKKLLQSMEQLEMACGVNGKSKATSAEKTTKQPANIPEANVKYSNPKPSMFMLENGGTTEGDVKWLIPGIIPAGKFLLLHGPPGIGKTTASCSIADKVISETGQTVMYIDLEQKGGDIREKMKAMSSDKKMLKVVKPSKTFSLFKRSHQEDMLGFVRDDIDRSGRVALVIVDSLMAATGGELNQGIVGGAALFFNKMTAELGCTILLIHHNNKSKDDGQAKIYGSSLIAGAVVMSWQIDQIENCEFARKLVVSKSNIRDLDLGTEIVVGQYPGKAPVVFRSEAGHTIDISAMKLVDQCRTILLEQLIDGEEKLAEDVKAVLGDRYSPATISRASKQLGIIKKQVGDKRFWNIPQDSLIFKLYKSS